MVARPGDQMASGTMGRGHLRASDADREQLIDTYDVAYAILVARTFCNIHPDPDYAAAIASAYNEWPAETWLTEYNHDGSFKGSITIAQQDPALAARPLAKAKQFTRALDLPMAQSPIVPIVLGDAAAALAASRLLEDEGFLVAAIRPPTVPAGTARLRFAFTAGHPDEEIARLARVVRERILT